jgi:ABC-type dipeptide/oligopeptide/nickel transport systems, permease components
MSALHRFFSNPVSLVGSALFGFMVLVALLAPLLFPGDPFRIVGQPLLAPGQGYLLGTDTLGRDIAATIAYGARTSLIIGIGSAVLAVLIGLVVGGTAGYFRGSTELVLMRFTEFFQTIPAMILAILIVAVLTASLWTLTAAIAIVSWPSIARLVRAEFASLGGREFILAAESLGAGNSRIVFLHLLPNSLSSIVAVGSLLVGTAILLESGLSFLGLGDPNQMSLGLMISAGRSSLRSAWWISTFPGAAVALTVLGINLLGDGLNDALNPKLGKS